MKDLENDESSSVSKSFEKVAGIKVLNYMLSCHKYISNSRRNLCLKYFVDNKITELMVVDRAKLKELETIRRKGIKGDEVIPHSRMADDFLDFLINARQISKKENFFIYERNQLLLFADEKCLKLVEKVLRQMGLNFIYFRGALK